MEPDKSLKEALLRSHQATEKANQEQHMLYNMGTGADNPNPDQANAHQPKLHETPRNLIQSWDTLRQLDEELANKKAANKTNNNRGKV
ncbi:hypothetical protein H9Q13_06260 [Pontibacter sp. JH31]|uniref:Uncharacterized protein n=1 Tax=Pontibacter aquaedesilientis TaxID=2766980 RepID=A0ABR7XGL5_9BACT|nr:hypothetical protein [Pontibacter aquaedesilientis]MBD1396763.1 hypothetical protein [Pontibacter aquaedesilientis]